MRKVRMLAIIALVSFLLTGAVFAQLRTGNVYGKVVDPDGNPLPGVTVTLSGEGVATQTTFTDEAGNFRFLGLPPGKYVVEAKLEGFGTTRNEAVYVNVGKNTEISLSLSAEVGGEVEVVAESPLLDTRKITTGATVTQEELEKVPSARDPWVILQTTPGVLVDRVNVGGSESGQQSQYVGPGSSGDNAVWAVDGVIITDMAAVGSSPTYYDFDAFEEMQITTGGSDAALPTGGVALNMVTKRGTNEWRGSARLFRTDPSFPFSKKTPNIDPDDLGPGQTEFKGNRTEKVDDYGFEVGGPIVRDKFWIWGHYGVQKPVLITANDIRDATDLQTYGLKLSGQLTSTNSFTFFHMLGDKRKYGRNAGPTRTEPTTWDQKGPTPIYKIDDTQIFGTNFFLTGLIAYVGGGFQLTPKGGYPDGPMAILDENFIWQANFGHYETTRPQRQLNVDGSFFFNTGDLAHELKFGLGYRDAEVESLWAWPSNGLRLDFYTAFGFPYNVVIIAHDQKWYRTNFYNWLYVQDVINWGNATFNVGLRYDKQWGKHKDVTIPAVPGYEDYYPQITVGKVNPEGDPGFEWTSIVPRFGLTWAFGENNNIVLRASYNEFADQLGIGYVDHTYGMQYSYLYFFYRGDLNGDGVISRDETIGDPIYITPEYYVTYQGAPNYNRFDNFDPPMTREFIVGLDYAIRPEFVVGATYTYRKLFDLAEGELLVEDASGNIRPHTRSDYCYSTDITGNIPYPIGNTDTYSQPVYGFCDGITYTGASIIENGDREQTYGGLTLYFNKRLSNRWMLRGFLNIADWKWNVPDSELEDPNHYLPGAHDGDSVLQGSGSGSGNKGAVYIKQDWSWSLNGLYQVAPEKVWGFDVAFALTGRSGYPIPYHERVTSGTSGLQRTTYILVTDNDKYSNPDIFLFDLSFQKGFTFNDFNITAQLDIFNLFNNNSALQRRHRVNIGSAGWLLETVPPRIVRLGVRFKFR